jgi:hypothetical protein
MRIVRVEIQRPIWGGGKPAIGVADFRAKGADVIEAEIMYKRKDGTRSYPDKYHMPVSALVNYPIQVVGGGVKLFVAPLADWEVV